MKYNGLKAVQLQKEDKSWVTVSLQDVMELTGLSESAAGSRLRASDSYAKVMRKRGQHGSRTYTLNCGREVTLNELLEESEVKRATLYSRVEKKGWRDYDKIVALPPVETWENTPTRIIAGIPLNPSYLDGITRRNSLGDGVYCTDREGKIMSDKKRTALMKYREENYKIWLKQRNA